MAARLAGLVLATVLATSPFLLSDAAPIERRAEIVAGPGPMVLANGTIVFPLPAIDWKKRDAGEKDTRTTGDDSNVEARNAEDTSVLPKRKTTENHPAVNSGPRQRAVNADEVTPRGEASPDIYHPGGEDGSYRRAVDAQEQVSPRGEDGGEIYHPGGEDGGYRRGVNTEDEVSPRGNLIGDIYHPGAGQPEPDAAITVSASVALPAATVSVTVPSATAIVGGTRPATGPAPTITAGASVGEYEAADTERVYGDGPIITIKCWFEERDGEKAKRVYGDGPISWSGPYC